MSFPSKAAIIAFVAYTAVLSGICVPGAEPVRSKIIIDVTSFGAKPNSGEDATIAVKAALEKIASLDGTAAVLKFPTGRYDFMASDAPRMFMAITAVHQQWDFIAGIYLNGLRHLTIDGCGSELVFHSRMTPIIINQCEDVEIFNLSIDHVRPTVSEFTVTHVGETFMDVEIHPDSWYTVDNGKFFWVGADSDRYVPQLFQPYDPSHAVTWRENLNLGLRAEGIAKGKVRFHYPAKPKVTAGQIWQMRGDGIRNQQGSVVNLSKNVRWTDVDFYFCTGLGIVSQLSEDLAFRRVNIEPRKDSGRTCASFADGIHCCNCSGKVLIEDCRIVGTQDDPINVYGNDLSIISREKPNELLLSYPNQEQCGYLMFFPGDDLMLLRKRTLLPFLSRKIISAELIDKMTQRVVLDGEVPEDCIGQIAENRTRMPEIIIRGCYFARTPTRGVLVSSWRKTLIENNFFDRTQMAAILVNHGDPTYFMQGAVEDLTIRNNTFEECHGGIYIQPEQPVVNRNSPVDKEVRIVGNRFLAGEIEYPIFWARSTQSITIKNNQIEGGKPGSPLIWLNGCSEVVIKNNQIKENPTGIIEMADFDPDLPMKGICETDKGWRIIRGKLREGSK